jgi:hypothetical protein
MRRVLWGLLVAVLLVAMLPAAGVSPVQAQTTDDELVVLTRDGRIEVRDPNPPPGGSQVPWSSPSTGWEDVATGDFNGDGDDEILALRGGEARVFDPFIQPGRIEVVFGQVISGFVWEQMTTGDLNGDGRAEIIMTRNTSEGNVTERLQVFYSTNSAATSWTLGYNEGFGAPWLQLTTGDTDNDGRPELAAIRNVDNPRDHRIIIWDPPASIPTNPNQVWPTLYNNGSFDFPWLAIEIGEVVIDSSGRKEIVTTRSGVLADLNSYLVFRCCSGSSLIDVAGAKYYPYFTSIGLGDVNASGDEEVFLLRDPESSSVALIGINYGSDPMAQFETLAGERQWKRVRTGDFDADSRAEVAVMSAGEYRIFTEPASGTTYASYPGSFAESGVFAVGDIDGRGQPPSGATLNLSETNVQLTLQSGQGASKAIQVTNSSGSTVINWTATVIEGQTWLSVNPTSGVTPGTLNLVISNTSSLVPGQYTGRVRVDGGSGVANSPQDIVVQLTIAASEWRASPTELSWTLRVNQPTYTQTVMVYGNNIPWSATTAPMSEVEAILAAGVFGEPLAVVDGAAVLGDAAAPQAVEQVPWLVVNPTQGTATVQGTPVSVTVRTDLVPAGFSEAAVVFVAQVPANPAALVVKIRVLALTDQDRIEYLPLVLRNP